MRPLLLRPACFLPASSSDFSGSTFDRSEKSIVVMKRRPGDVGRYFLTGMLLLEIVDAGQFDLLSGLDGDDGFFEVALFAVRFHAALGEVARFTAHVHG